MFVNAAGSDRIFWWIWQVHCSFLSYMLHACCFKIVFQSSNGAPLLCSGICVVGARWTGLRDAIIWLLLLTGSHAPVYNCIWVGAFSITAEFWSHFMVMVLGYITCTSPDHCDVFDLYHFPQVIFLMKVYDTVLRPQQEISWTVEMIALRLFPFLSNVVGPFISLWLVSIRSECLSLIEVSYYQHLCEWSGYVTEQEYREVCWSGSVTVGWGVEGVSCYFTSLSLVAPTTSVVAVTSPTPKPSEILCYIGAMEEILQIKPLKLLSFHPTSSVIHHLSIQVSSHSVYTKVV
jgi:hypothetical protein